MVKRLLSLFLVTVLVFGSISVGVVSASAADDTMDKLVYLIKKFPNGKYWNHTGANNPDGVTSSPCSSHKGCDYFGGCSCNSYGGAIQCMGYAAKISYEITGVDRNYYEESSTLDVSKLRVGDIIRSNGHSVCVTGVNGSRISITDCNYGPSCIIRWTTVDAGWFTKVEYVLHLKGNERTNTNVIWHDTYNGTVTPEEPVTPPVTDDETLIGDGEIWQMDEEDSLNIRKSKSTYASIVGSVPAGAKFDVYEKSVDGEYLWAKVQYDGTEGYSVLNYATYISGKHETPELTDIKKSYGSSSEISLNWTAVSGADKYQLSLYDSGKNLIKNYTSTKNSYSLPALKAGKYYVKVASSSSIASSWVVTSDLKTINVVEDKVAVTKVSIRKTGSIEVGKSGNFNATVEPENATNKELVWTSSDTTIATVDSNGKVTGIAPGKVVIKCASKENSKLYALCDFTVKPSSVKTIQTASGTTESTVGLKWSKSAGATGYTLYRYNESTKKYVKLAEGKGTSYTDKNLKASTKYTYAVRPFAVVDGVRIDASYQPVTATTTPTAIKVIKQTGSDTGRVRIQWEKKEGAYSYVVFKYNPGTKKFEKIGATTETVFIDSDKPATKVYYRVVSAVKTGDGYAGSKSSPTLTAITGLEKPKVVKTQSNASAVKLTWNKVDYATHYQIFKLVDGKRVLVKTVTASTTSYTENGLKSGVAYTYYVRAARNHSASLKLYSNDTTVKVATTGSF